VVESGQPLQTDGLDAGWFVVQDEASQLITLLAGETPGSRVLDACASPGNKTTAVAAATSGLVVACDVRDRRMALLARTVHRARAANVRLVQADLGRPLPFGAVFDTVIVDVPCSGLGTLRRDPDIRWRRHPDDLPRLAAAALGILRHAATGVAPGGRLVYATCSSEPEENDAVVAAFLASDLSFTRLDARRAHAALPAAIIDEDGYLRTRPDRHALEAFFGAVFVRDSRT
jgi:16S rRNA (cytosine967-C5)-methyltransferase